MNKEGYFTEEEQKIYNEAIKKHSIPKTSNNIWDAYANGVTIKDSTPLQLNRTYINFNNTENMYIQFENKDYRVSELLTFIIKETNKKNYFKNKINKIILNLALSKASADLEEPKQPFRSWYLMLAISFLIFISGGYDGK